MNNTSKNIAVDIKAVKISLEQREAAYARYASQVTTAELRVVTWEDTHKTALDTAQAKIKSLEVIDFAKEAGSDSTTGPNKIGSVSTNYLDSPSSTSSVTYKVQLMSAQNNALAQMGASGAKSTMTLMEISV